VDYADTKVPTQLGSFGCATAYLCVSVECIGCGPYILSLYNDHQRTRLGNLDVFRVSLLVSETWAEPLSLWVVDMGGVAAVKCAAHKGGILTCKPRCD
jgi:hypothetical protein